MDMDMNTVLNEAYEFGYRKGREDAAAALADIARGADCKFVRTDWPLDDLLPSFPSRWVAANYAVGAARGDL